MLVTNFCTKFFKNILLYTNCGLAKTRSVHRYVIPWMFYFGVNCRKALKEWLFNHFRKIFYCEFLDAASKKMRGANPEKSSAKERFLLKKMQKVQLLNFEVFTFGLFLFWSLTLHFICKIIG